jgi:adenylate cyclase
LALTTTFDYFNRWSDNPDGALAKAGDLAARAIAADPNESLGYVAAAVIAENQRDLVKARGFVEKALLLNPNDAFAISNRGTIAIYAGQPELGIPDLEQAMRIDPGFSHQYLHNLGIAHLFLGHYETAVMTFEERIRIFPGTDASRAYLAASLGHLGQVDRAREVWAELKKINPNYVLAERLGRLPFENPADPAKIVAGLAKAGLPD